MLVTDQLLVVEVVHHEKVALVLDPKSEKKGMETNPITMETRIRS